MQVELEDQIVIELITLQNLAKKHLSSDSLMFNIIGRIMKKMLGQLKVVGRDG
jgi:hypothetical protein